jgi:hypothetical protein
MDLLSLGLVILIPLSGWLHGTSKASTRGVDRGNRLLGCVFQLMPFFNQKNGEIIALALPINLAVWWAVYRLTLYRRTSLASSAAL